MYVMGTKASYSVEKVENYVQNEYVRHFLTRGNPLWKCTENFEKKIISSDRKVENLTQTFAQDFLRFLISF